MKNLNIINFVLAVAVAVTTTLTTTATPTKGGVTSWTNTSTGTLQTSTNLNGITPTEENTLTSVFTQHTQTSG